ncbi:sigma-70 family RNA polymerase sigma factor [Streptacidiphilus cavernicola]|uniref:Sigma-70 family RNA polymerase sigma factor n=1 Tax=Streptacidiphilus cavernicola TaxID=3342716 RepID=A0ABV6VWT5_9ACTN
MNNSTPSPTTTRAMSHGDRTSRTDRPERVDRTDRVDELAPWMRACAAGDAHAFAVLYTSLFPQIRATAWAVLHDRAQAEEVAQDVIAEVWRGAARFDSHRGQVTPWVLTIARHRATDRARSRATARHHEERYAHLTPNHAFDTVAEEVLNRLDAHQVRGHLGQLSDLQRQALALVYLHGSTHAAGARTLGVPLGTFKSRVRDALTHLRRELHPAATEFTPPDDS